MPFNLDPKTLASLPELNNFIQTWQFLTFCSTLNYQRKIAEMAKQIAAETEPFRIERLNGQLENMKAYEQAYGNLYSNMLNTPQNLNEQGMRRAQINAKAALDSRLKLIEREFKLMQDCAEYYKNYKGLGFLERYKEAKKEFLKDRSQLSVAINSARKTGAISEEDYQKYKESQVNLYRKTAQIEQMLKSLTQVKEQTATKEQTVEAKEQTVTREQTVTQRQTVQVDPRRKANEATYGINPQRPISRAASKIVSRVSEHIPKARVANHGINVLEREMNQINASMGTTNEEYQTRVTQHAEEVKKGRKEERKAGLKRNVDPELLRQRDRLAMEIEQMKRLYGTANSEEYQARVEQLAELDKKIFGRKAARAYRDFNKPIALVGASQAVELPKNYVAMRLQHQESKSR